MASDNIYYSWWVTNHAALALKLHFLFPSETLSSCLCTFFFLSLSLKVHAWLCYQLKSLHHVPKWQQLLEQAKLTALVEGESPILNNATLICSSNSICRAFPLKQEIKTAAFYQGIIKLLCCRRVSLCAVCVCYTMLTVHPGGWQQRDKAAGRIPYPFWFPNLPILTNTLICESVQSLNKQPIPSPPK